MSSMVDLLLDKKVELINIFQGFYFSFFPFWLIHILSFNSGVKFGSCK